MWVATLIARAGGLTPAHVAHFKTRLGAGDALWLAPQEAADLPLSQPPKDFEALWQEGQDAGVDVVIQPQKGRRKRLLLADMDSTMIQQECIDELAASIGVGKKVSQITARAMNGEIPFEGALCERVALLKGVPVSVIDQVIQERLSFTNGGAALVRTMKANGAFCALVSGGFTDFTAYVALALGFDLHRANRLGRDGDFLSGTVEGAILGREAKVETLEELIADRGLKAQDVLAVGDGANDLGMLGRAGLGVALHAKPAVAQQCSARINFGDLTALLYLQGYRKDEFVEV